MIERPRLIPAVILGAMALLALKLLAWTSEPYPGTIPVSTPLLASRADRPAGLEALSRAKTIRDPETTGAIDPPVPKADPAQAKADAPAAANPNNKADVMNGARVPPSPAERAILERLGERREEIDARMRELEMRERLLDTAEKKLDGRVGDLKAMEEKTGGPASRVKEEEAKAVKNLVIMYEAMKPKEAARVFDRLGLDVLVPVVQQMNPRKMSEVLAAMSPERAEKLTVALASSGRGAGIERAAADLAPLGGNELPAITPAPRR